MASFTTHVLDTSIGRPAPGVAVRLAERRGTEWIEVWNGLTGADGRAQAPRDVTPGVYRIQFETEPYFGARGAATFFPWVDVVFVIADAGHYHVPLLISPFGFSTYRGS